MAYTKHSAAPKKSGGGEGGAVESINGRAGAVLLKKNDVGLGNCDNTSDKAKPVSDATQLALSANLALTTETVTVKWDGVYDTKRSYEISLYSYQNKTSVKIPITADKPAVMQCVGGVKYGIQLLLGTTLVSDEFNFISSPNAERTITVDALGKTVQTKGIEYAYPSKAYVDGLAAKPLYKHTLFVNNADNSKTYSVRIMYVDGNQSTHILSKDCAAPTSLYFASLEKFNFDFLIDDVLVSSTNNKIANGVVTEYGTTYMIAVGGKEGSSTIDTSGTIVNNQTLVNPILTVDNIANGLSLNDISDKKILSTEALKILLERMDVRCKLRVALDASVADSTSEHVVRIIDPTDGDAVYDSCLFEGANTEFSTILSDTTVFALVYLIDDVEVYRTGTYRCGIGGEFGFQLRTVKKNILAVRTKEGVVMPAQFGDIAEIDIQESPTATAAISVLAMMQQLISISVENATYPFIVEVISRGGGTQKVKIENDNRAYAYAGVGDVYRLKFADLVTDEYIGCGGSDHEFTYDAATKTLTANEIEGENTLALASEVGDVKTLKTTAKTVVGAINELFDLIKK